MNRTARRFAKKAASNADKKAAKRPAIVTACLLPTAAITSALAPPPVVAAPGDLDPSFADVGRLGPILNGSAWSLDHREDDTILLGGGSPGFSYWGWYSATNFLTRLTDSGTFDPAFNSTDIEGFQIRDLASQPDGQVVTVGRRMNSDFNTRLVVSRFQEDGGLDPAFGAGGHFILDGDDYGTRTAATSVVLDPDGRIVVAGTRDDNLLVLRLLPDGSPDDAFADSGAFAGPANLGNTDGRSGPRSSLLRIDGGGYRVTTTAAEGCQVVALTADGKLDESFGDAGIATIAAVTGPVTYCTSMDAQPDGRLLIAGGGNDQGMVGRLTADGQSDPTFAADAVAAAMTEVGAVAADGNTAVVVAGVSAEGLSIMRLLPSGQPDATFGDAGMATVDLRADVPVFSVVNALTVTGDRNIVGAGGTCQYPDYCWWYEQAFVFRLLGEGGASSGVLGFREQYEIQAAESDGEFVVNVRRTGGRSGSVGVAWHTAAGAWQAATPGEDYVAASGSLSWNDGDTVEQQIRVPILADNTVEGQETVQIVLESQQDGAGLGMHRATLVIAADGAPHGQFGLPIENVDAIEDRSPISVPVSRDFYSSGNVSVTLTPVPGTASAGADFIGDPVTVTWLDGESGWKDVEIPIVNDTLAENVETFTIELSNPTGGALIGPLSSMTVNIKASDQPSSPAVRARGSGTIGVLSLLALALVRLLRRKSPFG
jgi:uncharacterized delta-60 repeat protein